MTISQNGYSVPTTPAAIAKYVHTYTIAGGPLRLRTGPCGEVLFNMAEFLNTLDPGKFPGIYGFDIKLITGGSGTIDSNHASATAFDWNAPEHPQNDFSRYRGWSALEVGKILAKLAELDHVIRWGSEYDPPTKYDPMHFEINADITRVVGVAKKIATPPAPQLTKGEPMFIVMARNNHNPSAEYVSNGQTRRWIPTPAYRTNLIAAGMNPKPFVFDTVTGMNSMGGPLLPGTPDAPTA